MKQNLKLINHLKQVEVFTKKLHKNWDINLKHNGITWIVEISQAGPIILSENTPTIRICNFNISDVHGNITADKYAQIAPVLNEIANWLDQLNKIQRKAGKNAILIV